MKKAEGVLSARQRIFKVLALFVIAFCGIRVLMISSEFSTDYVDIGETTLEESGSATDFRMELCIIDLLVCYSYETYSEADYYCLAAFADGAGNVNLCVLEVNTSDNCCDDILSYLSDETRQLGDCWVNGIFSSPDTDDPYNLYLYADLYADVLAQKETWLEKHRDDLGKAGALFGLGAQATVLDTELLLSTWPDEETYRVISGGVGIVTRILGSGVLSVALYAAMDLWTPRREQSKDA